MNNNKKLKLKKRNGEIKLIIFRFQKKETINKNQEEMNNKISKIKNTLQGIISRLDEAEDQISELVNKVERKTQAQQLHE